MKNALNRFTLSIKLGGEKSFKWVSDSYLVQVLRYAFRDAWENLRSIARVMIDTVIAIIAVSPKLVAYGSDEGYSDFMIEKVDSLPEFALLYMAIHFVVSLIVAPFKIHADQKRKITKLENLAVNPLRIEFDSEIHKFNETVGPCARYCVSVTNCGPFVIDNVQVRISKIECITPGTKKVSKNLNKVHSGLNLRVTKNKTSRPEWDHDKPEFSVRLNRNESAMFDVLRLCKGSGRIQLFHASRIKTGRGEYKPFPPGIIRNSTYRLELAATGDNLLPVTMTFEFRSQTNALIFRPVQSTPDIPESPPSTTA